MEKPPIAGLILAGGLSRRMGGGDKALSDFNGAPLIAAIIDRLAPQVGPLVLNANGDPARFAFTGLPVVADVVPHHIGPLAGLLTGFDWIARNAPECRWLATVPSDSPLFPADLVERLAAARADVAVARSGRHAHPVFSLWNVDLAERLRAMVAAGERRMGAALDRFDAAEVEWPDHPTDPFFNVNTPEDLAALRSL
ncbi:MAG TPA: molybdenum cofactor guanylyltransferase MobA [Candidatus Omnitrophota bacterium]|nr:molybdenum cofactor guanylyltransferase MobA [Candidatus Omnitrophota bacterium]